MKKIKNLVTLLTLFIFLVGADALTKNNIVIQSIFYALALLITNMREQNNISEIILGIPIMWGIKTLLIPVSFQGVTFQWWGQSTAIAAVISYMLIIIARFISSSKKK